VEQDGDVKIFCKLKKKEKEKEKSNKKF